MNESLPVIESGVVMPSIGDDVLFQLNGLKLTSPPLVVIKGSDKPLHAKVVYVWGPAMVNLVVWDHYGHMHSMTSVKFVPPGEDVQPGSTYCELAVIPGDLIVGEPADPAFGTEGIVAAAPDRPMSFGERAVQLQHNPSGDPAVYQCKSRYASLIDQLEARRQSTADGDVKRLCSIAITEAQGAQMWAVSALTLGS